jgi:hypothetical protein
MPRKSMDKSIKILKDKMEYLDLYDSYGVIMLRNGPALNVRHFFDYFLNTWQAYKVAQGNGDTKVYNEIMRDTGGIISNGELSINMDDITTMVAVHQMQDADTEHPSPLDDYIHLFDDEGDSKV